MGNLAIHPGEHVQEELEAMGMPAEDLAQRLGIPAGEFTALIRGEHELTADFAMRLGHFFGTSAEFWLGLQNLYDLRLAEQRIGDAVKKLPTMKQSIAA
jgi:addiction module HigA family antidote